MAEELNAFATTDDIEARWHELDQDSRRRAQVILEDATQLIMDEVTSHSLSLSDIPARTLTAITCAMVIRKLTVDDDHLGVTNSQQTAGSFSESFTYSNPMGDLYLTGAEKRRLGIGLQSGWHVDTAANAKPTHSPGPPILDGGAL